ncbi:hypothetical protein CUC00_01825 [Prevotella intermedia]|jgi:hypothetical protein|uniref:hypothetical protein n=1 Tax=Prevotella intermedia TaxID=28131 RepID=UPI0005EB3EA9|nr:hypothetical protein [Prevotella intermedia]ATV33695.1 hypothetical protein CTM44_08115 [Prevotella intermedia]ATV39895.1 hypothetical protein CUC00_01825 [Prevotella intermedia]
MKAAYKKPYDVPVTELISANISSVMYETSIPQGGDGEEGGEADAKPGIFEDEDDLGKTSFNLWED